MPTLGASLLVGTNNVFDVGSNALRIRKFWGIDADLSGSLTVASKPLVVSSTAGNALTWDSGGLYVAAGAIPSNPTLVDPLVRDTIAFGAKPNGAGDTFINRSAAGMFWFGASAANVSVWLQARINGSTSGAWFGQAVAGGTGGARTDITAGVYFNGSSWVLQEPGSPGAIISMMPGPLSNTLLLGIWDVPDSSVNLAERFALTRGGNLGLGDANPIAGLTPHSANRILKLASTGIFEANNTRTFVSIADNYYFHAGGFGSTITNNVSSYLQQADGVLTFANALSATPGTNTVSQRTRMTIDMNGTASFFSDGAQVSVDARNQIRVRSGASGLAGMWFMSGDNVDRAFLGMDAGSTTSWRLYGPAVGNIMTVTLSNGDVLFSRTVGISGNTTITGSLTGNGSVFNIGSTANIQLSPAGTIVHPSGQNTIHLGWQGLNWATVYAGYFRSDGQMSIIGGFHIILTPTNGGWIYCRSTGHTFFDGSAGTIVAPEIDNKLICGGTGNRWQYIAAVNGGINTCWVHEKEIVKEIVPREALDAVLKSPMYLFHPKDYEGTVNEEMTFAGPVNTSVDKRLQIGEGALTAAGHQAAYAIASIQELNEQITQLRAEVATLREAIAS